MGRAPLASGLGSPLSLPAHLPRFRDRFLTGWLFPLRGSTDPTLAGPQGHVSAGLQLVLHHNPAHRLALYVCVLLEVYDRVVAGYQGLQRLSQLAMYGIAGGVGVFVLATVVLDSSGNLPVSRSIAVWIRSERGISLGLTVFSLALVAFVAYFRLGVPNNVRVVFAVFGLLFAAQATLYTFHTQLGLTFREVRNSISFLIYIPCWLAGTLAFSKMGEIVPAAGRIRGRLDEHHEAMLTAKLKSFNESLLRVLKS